MNTQNPVLSLEAKYYTDPAIFATEQTGLFCRTWQFAGHVSQVRRPGDYFTFSISNQNLFCIRDQSGELHAYYNVCQHRAHELLTGAGNRKNIVCPYHAWSYRLTGELRNGPNLSTLPDDYTEKICLKKARIENFHGFLFVNLDLNAKPMDHWFPGVRQELKLFVPHIESLAVLENIEVVERCNWKVSVENYSECYHCQLNHRAFSTGVIKPSTYDIQPQGFCLRHTTECQNIESMSYPVDLDSNDTAGSYSSWFLWPMFSFQVYPGNVLNTYQWCAYSHDQVILNRGWYSVNGEESATLRNLAEQDRQTTVEEDIRLVESVNRGLHSRGYRPGPLVVDPNGGVQSEHSIAVLQQWMREAITNF